MSDTDGALLDSLGPAARLCYFDSVVDGTDAAEPGAAGKPDPALFPEAVQRLGVDPARCAVVKDALARVEAGWPETQKPTLAGVDIG
ncbi:HAD family hydrolase [Streptomyces sp. NPDC088097]|uniref:HAD family hydrolase n=1 Tax=Streptomyces sp. NPDC088097 TaxID=3365823 RepID=UPI0037FC296B